LYDLKKAENYFMVIFIRYMAPQYFLKLIAKMTDSDEERNVVDVCQEWFRSDQ